MSAHLKITKNKVLYIMGCSRYPFKILWDVMTLVDRILSFRSINFQEMILADVHYFAKAEMTPTTELLVCTFSPSKNIIYKANRKMP